MANQKLLDVMNGKITDTNQIAEVLANVSSAEFVDVLNHLDDKVIADLMHKLPEDKRSLIDDLGKVRNMMAKIHTKNETWDVSAEEYVKNSENLNKWKVDLNGKDFAQAREVVGWMNVPDEAKQLLMDTAVMKVKEESRNVKNLTEKQYKEAINFEIQLAVYQATVATSAVKQDKNPKVATQEAVNQFVEATRKQIESRKKENKPTTNFLDVSVDSILAYSASTNEWIGNRLAQAKQHFAKTKFGAEVAKITDAANKKLAAWDKKLCEHKTWGKTYQFMKKYSPIVGKVSRSVAVNMGMLALAGMTGPAGAALYAAYAVKTSSQSLIAEYKKEKQSNQNLNFCKFVADNKMLALKGAVGATTMVISGLVGYGNLGVNKLTARAVSTSVMTGLNIAVDKEQSAKGAKKSKSWVKNLALSTAGLALSALGLSSCGDSETEVRTKLPNGGIELPDDANARLLAMQTPGAGTDSIKADSTLVDNTAQSDTTAVNNVTKNMQNRAEDLATKGSDASKGLAEDLKNSQEECFPQNKKINNVSAIKQQHVVTGKNDCGEAISKQVEASDDFEVKKGQTIKQWWDSRTKKFIDCKEKETIKTLIAHGVFKTEKMPGIGSTEEFLYKYSLMKKLNLTDHQELVEAMTDKVYAGRVMGLVQIENYQNALTFKDLKSVGVDTKLVNDILKATGADKVSKINGAFLTILQKGGVAPDHANAILTTTGEKQVKQINNAYESLLYKDENNDMHKLIADGMNSYDNYGNYLCADLKSEGNGAGSSGGDTGGVDNKGDDSQKDDGDTGGVDNQGDETQNNEQDTDQNKDKEPENIEVKEPERRTISIMDVTTGKDYRNPDLFIMKGEMTPELLEEAKVGNRKFVSVDLDNGKELKYNFKGDDLVVSRYTNEADERTKFIAEHIQGLVVEQHNGEMVDATNAALSVQARLKVYHDLLVKNELKDAKAEWGDRFMQELNGYGLSYDPEKRTMSVIEEFDRKEALAKAQKDAEIIKDVKKGELNTNGKNKDGNGFLGTGKLLNKKANSI